MGGAMTMGDGAPGHFSRKQSAGEHFYQTRDSSEDRGADKPVPPQDQMQSKGEGLDASHHFYIDDMSGEMQCFYLKGKLIVDQYGNPVISIDVAK